LKDESERLTFSKRHVPNPLNLSLVGLVKICSSATRSQVAHIGLPFPRAQSSRLAVLGGRKMSFNVCRGTLGSLAMFTAIKNASSRVSSFALDRRPGSFSK
jgi:hypothetical protein